METRREKCRNSIMDIRDRNNFFPFIFALMSDMYVTLNVYSNELIFRYVWKCHYVLLFFAICDTRKYPSVLRSHHYQHGFYSLSKLPIDELILRVHRKLARTSIVRMAGWWYWYIFRVFHSKFACGTQSYFLVTFNSTSSPANDVPKYSSNTLNNH